MLARLARRAILRRVRNYATAATDDSSRIRNIALVAHIGVVHFQQLGFPMSDSRQTPGKPL